MHPHSHASSVSAAPTPSQRLRVTTPRVFDGGWADAHELALTHTEPVFVPVTPFADDRGWSLMNLFNGVMSEQGQINFSMQYPGVVKAWHRHRKQTDFWACINGHLKVGVYREDDATAWMIITGQMRPGVVVIPPTLWHGAACVGPEPAGLLYYMTHSYDHAQPDEQRRAWDSVDGFPWGVRHG